MLRHSLKPELSSLPCNRQNLQENNGKLSDAVLKVRLMDGWMDGWMDGRTDGWVDGWMDGWVD